MTDYWGPKLWYILHTISYNYSDTPSISEIKYTYLFFYSIVNIIPCSICKNFYIKFLSVYPLSKYVKQKKLLIDWVLLLHNAVNKKLNKRIYNLDEVNLIYLHKSIDNTIILEFIEHIIKINEFSNNIFIRNFLLYLSLFYPDKNKKFNIVKNNNYLHQFHIRKWFAKVKIIIKKN